MLNKHSAQTEILIVVLFLRLSRPARVSSKASLRCWRRSCLRRSFAGAIRNSFTTVSLANECCSGSCEEPATGLTVVGMVTGALGRI